MLQQSNGGSHYCSCTQRFVFNLLYYWTPRSTYFAMIQCHTCYTLCTQTEVLSNRHPPSQQKQGSVSTSYSHKAHSSLHYPRHCVSLQAFLESREGAQCLEVCKYKYNLCSNDTDVIRYCMSHFNSEHFSRLTQYDIFYTS